MAQARARAQAVLRLRGAALGRAVLPAAVAVVLWAGRLTGRTGAVGSPDAGAWGVARWTITGIALLVLAAAGLFALRVRRVPPPAPLSAPVAEREAPELYRLVRELAERLEVPAPGRIALAPDCDSWLEDDATSAGPPALVIGSPFLWWMRVDELRALLAPVVAGGAATTDREITAARRFVRGLDALALGRAGGSAHDAGPAAAEDAQDAEGRASTGQSGGPVAWWADRLDRALARPARTLLRRVRHPAAVLERAVAAGAAERAQSVDYGRRIAAQEQVGLAYAGWDRMLDRVALPAWRIGRSPERLNAGAVSALTELSRRDRLADGYESRLSEQPACDLLEDPGEVDRRISELAARIFYGPSADRTPVGWDAYPGEVVARIWRARAAVLLSALRGLDEPPGGRSGPADRGADGADGADGVRPLAGRAVRAGSDDPRESDDPSESDDAAGPAVGRVLDLLASGRADLLVRTPPAPAGPPGPAGPAPDTFPAPVGPEGLGEGVAALVCCAAMDTGVARPGLDWLDGPVLLVEGRRRTDLAPAVARAVERGDTASLRTWLAEAGIPADAPLRPA
jgi:hypothetical protein